MKILQLNLLLSTVPQAAGYSTELREESVRDHEYPAGPVWQDLFEQGKFSRPAS